MNLLFLMNLTKQHSGGTYSVFHLAEHLAKLGHNAVVFYAAESDFVKKRNRLPRFSIRGKFTFSSKFRGRSFLNRKIEQAYDGFILEKYLRRYGDSTDFVIGYQRRMAIKAAKLGQKYKIKVANFVFETPNWLKEKWGGEWESRYKNAKLKKSWNDFQFALSKSHLIFAISRSTAKKTKEWLGRSPDGIIYPGIDISLFSHTGSNVIKHEQIIYVGRLSKNKNVNEVIKAVAKLKNNVKLIICGSGAEAKNLKRIAYRLNLNCEFRGTVSEVEKWSLISQSRFMVFPSSFEGFGMPPMEALACNIPCVCADIPVIREVYGDYVVYFKEHDIGQLAKKMRFMYNNHEYCEELVRRGKNYVLRNFGWEKSAKKIETILFNHCRNDMKNTYHN